jgi:eukaryotic-like serine/threonine-protein kinase
MLEVTRTGDLLIVSESPGTAYRILTWSWPALLLLGALTFGDGLAFGPASSAGGWALSYPALSAPFLVLAALLLGWRTTVHRFDRIAGKLVIQRGGPIRPQKVRELLLSTISAAIDRRLPGARAIELVLSDRSTVIVTRARVRGDHLDGLVRDLSEILKKPVQLAEGVLVAGRFEIERFVGQGGMGVVYRALDRRTGTPVALKLSTAPVEEDEPRERFAREMELLSTLDHPRICRYVSHGAPADGHAFLAMQWLEGEDLRAPLARGALSLDDSLHVLRCTTEAIAAVHTRGIIHRDLKPANLFLRGKAAKDLLLLDFGIARRLDSPTGLTGSHAIIGTPHYMAPEQASSSGKITPAADVFAIGCIFYECLSGAHPFEAAQLVGVLARILFDTPDPVDALRPNVPVEWVLLLQRMLAKDPAQRPADGSALLAEVLALPPATGETSSQPRARLAPQASRDAGDQVLVSVVLATLCDDALGLVQPLDRFESIRSEMNRFRCPIERLADGSLLASVLPKHSATDQVRIAARCALYLRELIPEARIAVATGRAPVQRVPRLGDAVDRALLLLEPSGVGEGVRLDSVTAGLLDAHFLTTVQAGVILLVSERQDLDESRPLLGKPTPCVGRELELAQLEGLMSSAVDEAAPKAAVVLGSPGIGKSRLRHELLRRLREHYPEAVQLVGYGDPLSAGSPHVLVGDALRRYAGIRAGDDAAVSRAAIVDRLSQHVSAAHRKRVSEFLGELCGIPFDAEDNPPLQAARDDHRAMNEQITLAFVDWLAAECRAHAVAFLLEDVQWGDALSLKLLEGALRELQHAPLLVLSFGRPEAEEAFPKLFFGQRALSLTLRALSDRASELLVRRVLGDAVPDDDVRRIVRLSTGNALFLEELIRAAAEGKAGDVPETVLAMLQARLSRFSPEARLVLRSASVFGERFWQGGVRELLKGFGEQDTAERALVQLMDAELVTRERSSRFPDELEFSFRHALVSDAAYGLLAEEDRKSGHANAGRWLEARGETDAVVLARHAEGSGDGERAIVYYTRAAEQSLGQYDFEQALIRAQKGVACGAAHETLGILTSVRSSAFYSRGQWPDAAEAGLLALDLLPRGSVWWCSTVERLLQVLPNIGDVAKTQELSDGLLAFQPLPGAHTAYARALHSQLLGYSVSAAHERGQRTLDFIDALGPAAEPDMAARGYARLWRGVFNFILGDDLEGSLRLTHEAIRALDESRVLYRLTLAHTVQSFVYWGMGQLELSERSARKARAIAEQIHDEYHAALAAWYLSLVLADRTEPEKLDESERCAALMILRGDNPVFHAVAWSVFGRLALARGDFARAEFESRRARDGLMNMPPYALITSAALALALVKQGRHTEACEIARADSARLDLIRGPVCTEVLFRVAVAEVLHDSGQREEAERALSAAERQIDIRASKMSDAELRTAYLTQRPENRRAVELARLIRATRG